MQSSEYRHQERIDNATEQLRQAERQVEQIEEKIRSILHESGASAQPEMPPNYFVG
jgi:hypothetical protein